MSIVPKETIEAIAQSVGISNLPADVSAALAPDAEYRLRELMQVRCPSLCPCDYPGHIPITSGPLHSVPYFIYYCPRSYGI
jgi:hypothetical protein